MKLHWTEWAALAAMVAAGCVAIYAGLTRAVQRAVRERQRETERQLNAMATTVKALQTRVAELGREQTTSAGERADAAKQAAAENQAAPADAPTPEILAALTAAATAYVGKKARIRSAALVPAEENGAGAWAQQGRVIVQTSHNLRTNG